MNFTGMTPRQQIAFAVGAAMERGVPFSWIRKGQDVQCGVYLRYSQAHFAAYVMPRMV